MISEGARVTIPRVKNSSKLSERERESEMGADSEVFGVEVEREVKGVKVELEVERKVKGVGVELEVERKVKGVGVELEVERKVKGVGVELEVERKVKGVCGGVCDLQGFVFCDFEEDEGTTKA